MRNGLHDILFAALAMVTPALAHASPQDLFGFGPRSMAMGATGATFADDWSAVHANPAGLSRAREREFSLGYMGAGYELYTAVPVRAPAARLPVDRASATTIGVTLPLPFGGILRDRIAIGLGFYAPTALVVRGRILRPEQQQFINLADRSQSIALQLGIGVDVTHGFRVGIGFAALAAVTGSVLIAADPTGRIGSRVDDQLVTSFAPVIGASWDHGPFRLGAVFRGVLEGRFGVSIQAQDIGLSLPVFNIAGIAQYDPWQIALEAGYVRRGWTVAIAGTFKHWSGYPGPLEPTTANSPAPPATNFADTLVVRVGGEHRWDFHRSFVAVRAGYFYEPTPAPLATGGANYLDNDQHVATLGLGVGGRALGTRYSLDLFGQAHFLAERTAVKSADVPADGSGAPSIRYGGAIYVLGLTATVTF